MTPGQFRRYMTGRLKRHDNFMKAMAWVQGNLMGAWLGKKAPSMRRIYKSPFEKDVPVSGLKEELDRRRRKEMGED